MNTMARRVKRIGPLALCGLLAACDASSTETEGPATATSDVAVTASSPPVSSAAAPDACVARREAAREEPAVPGNEAFERDRSAFIGRVRGATLLWKREPKVGEGGVEAVAELESSRRALRAVRDAIHEHRKRPERLRALFLREGYFYVGGVDAAVAAVQQLGLTHLFDTPSLRLSRDGTVMELKREKDRYVHEDGQPAELLFGDRFGEADEHLAGGGAAWESPPIPHTTETRAELEGLG
ncbi:MAG: hypothetical protein KC731_37665, partial [Myxococcales bacterium]|nr:hypothetical protein [Myxococcales bacterium]